MQRDSSFSGALSLRLFVLPSAPHARTGFLLPLETHKAPSSTQILLLASSSGTRVWLSRFRTSRWVGVIRTLSRIHTRRSRTAGTTMRTRTVVSSKKAAALISRNTQSPSGHALNRPNRKVLLSEPDRDTLPVCRDRSRSPSCRYQRPAGIDRARPL